MVVTAQVGSRPRVVESVKKRTWHIPKWKRAIWVPAILGGSYGCYICIHDMEDGSGWCGVPTTRLPDLESSRSRGWWSHWCDVEVGR